MTFRPKPLKFPSLNPLKPSPLPQNRLIAMAVKRLLLRQSAKAGGGAPPAVCVCEYHASAYNDFVGGTDGLASVYYTAFIDGATVLSQVITITESCCVRAVGTILAPSAYDVVDFELEQPLGTIVVDQEDETTNRTVSLFHYSAWEVLPAGVYTYYLVNRSGASRNIYAAQLKIEAVSCTGPPCACQHHADAYNEMAGTTLLADQPSDYDVIIDGATVLSQAITITETCCILAVGTLFVVAGTLITSFELEQPLGTTVVDQEDETTSGGVALLHYAAWEVLPAGIYTYSLVNRSGAIQGVRSAQLKIIAVRCV